ncbi:MAG: glycosyltransferase, partial [Planctomycetes bacterium]|nr:glycosyltransferase [Planctomycetota bacterium]
MTLPEDQAAAYASREFPGPKSTAKSTQRVADSTSFSSLPPIQQQALVAEATFDVERSPQRPAQRPLRVVHIGPCFSRGGAENHAIDLARFLDPSRVRIEKCIVTNPDMLDASVAADMPAPVEIGDVDAVRQASREHDIVLFWGMMLDPWLAEYRPPLCVYLAHGDSGWTHDLLEGSRHVVDHVIAVSRGVQRKVCNGYPSTVILNGIDTARLGQTRS